MLTIAAYDEHVEKLFEVVKRMAEMMQSAGIEYRLVGGLAVFLHVKERSPMAARVTNDVDVAIDRADLERISRASEKFGFRYRHAAGLDMLVDAEVPSARTAVHFVFCREKVRPHYVETVPGSVPVPTREGVLIAPVADLVRMKLTSFRLKDKVHLQDMDGVGLITPEIEAGLPDVLRQRLAEVRASE